MIEATAEGIDEQLLSHRPGKEGRPREDGVSQCHDAIDVRPVGQFTRCVDRYTGVLGAPGPDGIEVLQRETDRIHDLVTTGAGRIRSMLRHLLPHRLWLLSL